MTGALIGALFAALCALAVLLMLVAERRPEDGWAAWLRGSLDAWRSDELSGEKVRLRRSDVRDTPVEDLFSLGEPVTEPAYARPEELVARLEQVRTVARR